MATNHSVSPRFSIPMSGPDLTEAEIAAAVDVLRSGQLSRGSRIPAFENAFAERTGARYAVAVASGTAALHLSIIAAGVAEGDLVVTSPFSFVASANCVLYERAIPIFVDVDPTTGNLDPSTIACALDDLHDGHRDRLPPALRVDSHQGRVRAVLPVHVFGRPVDMKTLMAVARRRGVAVVEDACEAVGAAWNGRPVGSFGDAGCFGFYPNKQMTTGEGGMIVTNDQPMADLCRSLRNQGRGPLDHSLVNRLGYNYRLSEVAAALGLVQLTRLEELQQKRDRVARWYDERLADVNGVSTPAPVPIAARISWFAYVVRFDQPALCDAARDRLAAADIPSRRYFRAIPRQPFYAERFGYRPGDFPNAERLSDTCLALPFSGVMTEGEVDRVCAVLSSALRPPILQGP